MLLDGSSPLLCADPEECHRLVEETHNSALGLHLDTGHLKVSANSLGFTKSDFISKVSGIIRSIHHSDNLGEEDTNEPIDSSYWFLDYMQLFENAYHILEVHDQSLSQINRQFDLLKKSVNNS